MEVERQRERGISLVMTYGAFLGLTLKAAATDSIVPEK
jgi:hypothetical protein